MQDIGKDWRSMLRHYNWEKTTAEIADWVGIVAEMGRSSAAPLPTMHITTCR